MVLPPYSQTCACGFLQMVIPVVDEVAVGCEAALQEPDVLRLPTHQPAQKPWAHPLVTACISGPCTSAEPLGSNAV